MLNKRFCFLWMGQSLANLGDVFYVVAVISAVYAATDSAVFTAMVPVLFVAAQAVSGFLAPLVFQLQAIVKQTLLQQAAGEADLPVVLSAKGTMDALVFGCSVLAMGAAAEWLGPRWAYFLAAALTGIAALLALRLRRV